MELKESLDIWPKLTRERMMRRYDSLHGIHYSEIIAALQENDVPIDQDLSTMDVGWRTIAGDGHASLPLGSSLPVSFSTKAYELYPPQEHWNGSPRFSIRFTYGSGLSAEIVARGKIEYGVSIVNNLRNAMSSLQHRLDEEEMLEREQEEERAKSVGDLGIYIDAFGGSDFP